MESASEKSRVFNVLSELETLVAAHKMGPASYLLYTLLYERMTKSEFETPQSILRAMSNSNLPSTILIIALLLTSEFREYLFDARLMVADRLKCQLLTNGEGSVVKILLQGLL